MAKIKVTLSIGYPSASREDVIDIDNDEWSECKTDEERQELMDAYWTEWSNDYIDGSAYIIED